MISKVFDKNKAQREKCLNNKIDSNAYSGCLPTVNYHKGQLTGKNRPLYLSVCYSKSSTEGKSLYKTFVNS